ncbi:MAG: lysophospholipid acyltransferase family protein [Candidatus Methylomirabilales bacterium]
MKGRPHWGHLVVSTLVLAVAVPVAYLPLWISYPLGGALGRLIFFVDRRHRRVALQNLRLAFGGVCSPDEIVAMARSTFCCLGQTFVDTCRLVRLSPQALAEACEIEGAEALESPRARGQGIIYVTAHLGPWEYLPALSTYFAGEPLTVVARPLDNPYLDRLVSALRRRLGSRIVDKRKAMGAVLDVLRQGERVGVLIDQHVSPEKGVVVNFFGYPACTTSAPAFWALRSGAAVIPIVIVREGRGRFRVLLGKEVSVPPTGTVKEDVVALTAAMTAALEELIRQRPEQWLWIHRRWKSLEEGAISWPPSALSQEHETANS